MQCTEKDAKVLLYGLIPDAITDFRINTSSLLNRIVELIHNKGEAFTAKQLWIEILPFLHSPLVFDKQRDMFDIGHWNEALKNIEMVDQASKIDINSLTLKLPFKMSSLTAAKITEYTEKYFSKIDAQDIFGNELTRGWFKVLTMEPMK
jgi:hypothetical protein